MNLFQKLYITIALLCFVTGGIGMIGATMSEIFSARYDRYDRFARLANFWLVALALVVLAGVYEILILVWRA